MLLLANILYAGGGKPCAHKALLQCCTATVLGAKNAVFIKIRHHLSRILSEAVIWNTKKPV